MCSIYVGMYGDAPRLWDVCMTTTIPDPQYHTFCSDILDLTEHAPSEFKPLDYTDCEEVLVIHHCGLRQNQKLMLVCSHC